MDIKEYIITIESIQNIMKLIISKLKNNADNQKNLFEQIINYIENIRNIHQNINNLQETKKNTSLKTLIEFQEQLFSNFISNTKETEIKQNIDNLEVYIKNNELIIDIQ